VIYGVHESAASPQKKVPAPAGSHIAFVIAGVQLEHPTCKALDDTFPYYVPRPIPIKNICQSQSRDGGAPLIPGFLEICIAPRG
jgi:hypothetical protein